jgi:hypothetical protein
MDVDLALKAAVALMMAAGMYGMVSMIRKIVIVMRGEGELVRRLARDECYRSYVVELEQRHPGDDEDITPEELDEVRRLIVKRLADLEEKQRREVADALNQPTVWGRENYVRKLLGFTMREMQHQP